MLRGIGDHLPYTVRTRSIVIQLKRNSLVKPLRGSIYVTPLRRLTS